MSLSTRMVLSCMTLAAAIVLIVLPVLVSCDPSWLGLLLVFCIVAGVEYAILDHLWKDRRPLIGGHQHRWGEWTRWRVQNGTAVRNRYCRCEDYQQEWTTWPGPSASSTEQATDR